MSDIDRVFARGRVPSGSLIPAVKPGRVIGTAGLMVLFVVGWRRHTMALGGSGRANVVFAVACVSRLAYQGSASALALVPAGTNSSGRRRPA